MRFDSTPLESPRLPLTSGRTIRAVLANTGLLVVIPLFDPRGTLTRVRFSVSQYACKRSLSGFCSPNCVYVFNSDDLLGAPAGVWFGTTALDLSDQEANDLRTSMLEADMAVRGIA